MTNKERIKKVLSKDGFYYSVYYILKFLHIDRLLSDKFYVKLQYRCYTGRKLNLKSPQRFNEKLCYLKLYDHNPNYTRLVDKYEVKKYVSEKIGSEYIIPTLAKWNNPNDIDISGLPERFVLKVNHSGNNNGVILCKNKSSFNLQYAVTKLEKAFNSNMYMAGREWPYKDVERCIFAEEYMEDNETNELRDYKFFCFNGEVRALFVATGRNSEEGVKFNYFDKDYNHLGISEVHKISSPPPQMSFAV